MTLTRLNRRDDLNHNQAADWPLDAVQVNIGG
jgi:hypothetical protein